MVAKTKENILEIIGGIFGCQSQTFYIWPIFKVYGIPRLFLVGGFFITFGETSLFNMPTKLLSVTQYAKQVKKKTRQSVYKAIKYDKMHLLPGVLDIKWAIRC